MQLFSSALDANSALVRRAQNTNKRKNGGSKMLIKIAFAGAILFCGMSTAVAQDPSVIAEKYAYLMPAMPTTAEGLIVPIHSGWNFVGCVYQRS